MTEIGDFTPTGIFIIITAVLWLVYDVYLYATNKETISIRMHAWSKHFTAIAFLMGFIAGHWFWSFALVFIIGSLWNIELVNTQLY